MKILIHGINFSPVLTGIGKYSGEMVEWLAARGHEVRGVTAPPYYPEWRVGAGFSAGRYRTEIIKVQLGSEVSTPTLALPLHGGGNLVVGRASARQSSVGLKPDLQGGRLLVYRCPLWVPAKPSGLKRLLHLASFALSSLPVMLRQVFWRPDVVWVVEPALFCAPQAWLTARLCGGRAWLHVQDFEVDAAFDMGILPPGRLRDLVLWVERVLMRRFDVVSTISPNMLARLVAKGVAPARAVSFPNWVDTEVIHPLLGVNALRAELGIAPDRIVALYSGNMGEKQGLEVVLEAAQLLCAGKAQDVNATLTLGKVLFVMCGDGAARGRLMALYPNLPNVMWIPLQPMDRLNELLNMADIHLLPQRADVADLVMPSKLTGMLSSGRAVIATALPDTQVAQVVRQCGVVCAPGDAVALMEAIDLLAADAEKRAALGAAAREYALAHLGKEAVLLAFERGLGA